MSMRVAIFGFGKVGRTLFRQIYRRDDLEVVAINDIADPEAIGYLLRFDSLFGRFEEPVQVMDGNLYARGKQIPIIHQREPGQVPWYEYGVDVVIDATGKYRTRETLQRHLEAGADRVLLSTPPLDEIDKVYLHAVETEPIRRQHRIISCGSSTSNCTAMMLKVLDDAFGVQTAFFTGVHAYTSEQSLIDVPSGSDLRLSRAAVESIVPVQSWTTTAIEAAFPRLKGNFGGCKLNVPVPDVSAVDLVTTLDQEVTAPEINAVFRSASHSTMHPFLEYTEDPIVSSDVARSRATCLFDGRATMVVEENMAKVYGWYDQLSGHAFRIMSVLDQLGRPPVDRRKGGVA